MFAPEFKEAAIHSVEISLGCSIDGKEKSCFGPRRYFSSFQRVFVGVCICDMVYEEIADPFRRLVRIMERLQEPGGCPWDLEQTHISLKPYMIEEAYEALEAIDSGDDTALAE